MCAHAHRSICGGEGVRYPEKVNLDVHDIRKITIQSTSWQTMAPGPNLAHHLFV